MMWEKFSHPKQKSQDQILLGWVLGTDVPGCMLGWALSAEGSNRPSGFSKQVDSLASELTSQLLTVVRGVTLQEP